MSEQIAMTARVSGQVQGVNFRAWTRGQARRLKLTGWVRNEPDGTVSALFAGPPDAVRKMEKALWRGPPAASVTDVTMQEGTADPWPESFEVRR